MGNQWVGGRSGSGEDRGRWWGYRENDSGSKEHSTENRVGRAGSKELSRGRKRYWPVMTAGDGRLYFIPWRLWFKVIDLTRPQADEEGDASNDERSEICIDLDALQAREGKWPDRFDES